MSFRLISDIVLDDRTLSDGTDVFIVSTSVKGADITLTLPVDTDASGKFYFVKNINTNLFNVIVVAGGGENIVDGMTSVPSTTITPGERAVRFFRAPTNLDQSVSVWMRE